MENMDKRKFGLIDNASGYTFAQSEIQENASIRSFNINSVHNNLDEGTGKGTSVIGTEHLSHTAELLDTQVKELSLERHQFTFLYDVDLEFNKSCAKLKIRRCFFQDIFRRVLLLKFNRMGIYTREFYSEDMKNIHCVLKV
jgi:hypothetical protein